jgi:hypothetical protein
VYVCVCMMRASVRVYVCLVCVCARSCVHPSVRLRASERAFFCVFVCLCAKMCLYDLGGYLFVCVSLCLSVYQLDCHHAYMHACLSVRLSDHQSVFDLFVLFTEI